MTGTMEEIVLKHEGNDGDRKRTCLSTYRELFSTEMTFCLNFITFSGWLLTQQQYLLHRITAIYEGANSSMNATSVCERNKSSPLYQKQQYYQSLASQFDFYSSLAWTLPALFVATALPALSDYYGRRNGLLFGLAVQCVAFSFQLVVVFNELSYQLLIISSILYGLSGGFAAFIAICFARISDMTVAQNNAAGLNVQETNTEGAPILSETQRIPLSRNRTIRIVAIEMCGALGVFIASLGLNAIIKASGFKLTYCTFAVLPAVNFFYVLIFIPNERPIPLKVTLRQLRQKLYDAFVLPWKLYVDPTIAERVRLRFMLFVLFFVIGNMHYGEPVKLLFLMNEPLCFSSTLLGIYNVIDKPVLWIIGAPTGIFLFRRVLKFRPLSVIVVASISLTASLTSFLFVQTAWTAFIQPFFGLFMVLAVPITRSYMSQLVTADKQGTVYASIGVAQTACGLVFGPLYSMIYAKTVEWHHSFVFVVMAVSCLIPLSISLVLACYDRRHPPLLVHADHEE